MNIHEFQAKEILRKYGVATLEGHATDSAEGAAKAVEQLGGDGPWVVKAQIHAGGRGKAGGVKLVGSAAEAKEFAASLLGSTLVTHQTGPEGRVVNRIFVEQGCKIARELYLGLTLDRASSLLTVIASSEGGMEIEEVAANDADAESDNG